MGVPSYFRWLAEKYGKTVVDALEDLPQEVNGEIVKPDLTQPNPNGVEFDNLYLDMNGIIHNCSHPENKVRLRSMREQGALEMQSERPIEKCPFCTNHWNNGLSSLVSFYIHIHFEELTAS